VALEKPLVNKMEVRGLVFGDEFLILATYGLVHEWKLVKGEQVANGIVRQAGFLL